MLLGLLYLGAVVPIYIYIYIIYIYILYVTSARVEEGIHQQSFYTLQAAKQFSSFRQKPCHRLKKWLGVRTIRA